MVTDKEVKVCCDNRVMAIYDRASGALTSVSFSLAQAFLEMSRYDIRTNQGTVRELTELSRGGNNLTVVVKLGDDGEGRAAVVLSDSAGICRPLAAAKMTEQRWHCISPIGKIDFCVRLSTFELDLVIINPFTQEETSFSVAQDLDFSLLDREEICPQFVLELAADALPGMDWV